MTYPTLMITIDKSKKRYKLSDKINIKPNAKKIIKNLIKDLNKRIIIRNIIWIILLILFLTNIGMSIYLIIIKNKKYLVIPIIFAILILYISYCFEDDNIKIINNKIFKKYSKKLERFYSIIDKTIYSIKIISDEMDMKREIRFQKFINTFYKLIPKKDTGFFDYDVSGNRNLPYNVSPFQDLIKKREKNEILGSKNNSSLEKKNKNKKENLKENKKNIVGNNFLKDNNDIPITTYKINKEIKEYKNED